MIHFVDIIFWSVFLLESNWNIVNELKWNLVYEKLSTLQLKLKIKLFIRSEVEWEITGSFLNSCDLFLLFGVSEIPNKKK